MRCHYYTVDAFTKHPFEGAQIAILPEADGLSDEQMQTIAREFNLSETVFVLSPRHGSHVRRIRVFTPFNELKFAGHPTLAAIHLLTSIGEITADHPAVTAEGDTLRFVFEQPIGEVEISVRLSERQPFCEFGLRATYAVDRFTLDNKWLARVFSLDESDLGLDDYPPMVVVSDEPYMMAPIRSFEAVRRAKFDYAAWESSPAPETISYQALLFTTDTEFEGSGFHCRLLGPAIGINEDLPIGSSMPAFAGYLCEVGGPEHAFAAERGAGRFRRSLLHINAKARGPRSVDVKLGGTAVTVCEGYFEI